MIHAEISIYPMATRTTSVSFYIAKALESIRGIDDVRYYLTAMGTILESDCIDRINEAVAKMIEVVHNLGIARVEAVVKIDSRRDRDGSMEDKIASVMRYVDAD